MRSGREVQELLGERLREVLEEVHLPDDADQVPVVVHDGDVAVATRSASARGRPGPTGPGAASAGPWSCTSRPAPPGRPRRPRPRRPGARTRRARSGRRPGGPRSSVTNTESPVPVRWIASRQSAIDEPGGHGHGLAPADHRQGLRDQAGDARGDGALGEFGHRASVRARARTGGRRDRARDLAPRSASDTLAGVDRTRATGIALVVISAVAFGSGGLFAKPVYATGVDWLTLMAWRFAIGGGAGVGRAGVQPVGAAGAADGCRDGRCWGRSASACSTSPTPPPTTPGSRRCRSASRR